uniref:Uncharacterized protein n=2 Tax=Avena sativa TaxID=4498 RepID=A0ACD5XT09_AVESA
MTTDTDDVEQQRVENHAASISRITSDVLHEILLRLPISSLLGFLRTCHQWRDVIRDPCFVMGHADRAPEHLLLFLPRVDASASHKTAAPGRLKLFDEKWSVSTWAASSMDPEDHLFASCNGLLCFYRQYTLKIVNPVTGQCLHLSKPHGKLFRDLYYLYSFGFHPATGKYKLMYFHHEPRHGGRSSGQPFCFDSIQVYTLGEDRWREVTAPKQSCLVNLGVVNVDGAMYWIAEEEGTCCGVAVMRFDLKEETFVTLRPPPLKACEATDRPCDAPDLSYYVTEVDRTACLVTVPFNINAPRWRRYNAEVSGRMDVWMLESPAEDRWFLKYSINLPPSAPRFIPQPCFVHGEKILLHSREGDAFCRDVQGEGMMQVEDCSEVSLLNFRPHRYYETQSYLYKETLVPLDVYAGAAIARTSHWPLAPPGL